MNESQIKEKAIAYEALLAFFSDEKKAWEVLESLNIDYSSSFASYTREFTSSMEEEARFNSIWRNIRSSFLSSKIEFSVINNPGDVHFLYYTGNKDILTNPKLTFLGSVMPSLQARQDTALVVIEAIKNGYTIMAPFESGLGPYALSVAIKMGGNVVAVLSSELSKCPNEALLPLMEKIYDKGMLLTQFAPSVKREKWHVVLRNRFLSSFSDGFYFAEEKDGGPSWSIIDGALKSGKRVAIASSAILNPNYTWCRDRLDKGAFSIKKTSEIKKLFASKTKKKETSEKNEPDLFSFFGENEC